VTTADMSCSCLHQKWFIHSSCMFRDGTWAGLHTHY